jgi:Rod binding domain-containing protein
MNIPALSSDLSAGALRRASADATQDNDPAKVAQAAQQFEGILLRQILNESLKPLLENGPGAQVYGYFLTGSLAESIGKAGGLGLGSVLETQLTKGSHEH